jgi:hypothetical protein
MTNIFSRRVKTFNSSLLDQEDPNYSDYRGVDHWKSDPYGFGDFISLKHKMNFYAPETENTDKNINPPFTNDEADLDQVIKRGSTDLDMLRQHISTMPTREQFNLSTKDRILAALLAGGGALASGNVGTGIKIGQQITETPYNRALEQYKMKASGLADLADISEKQIGRIARVEDIRGSREDRKLKIQEMINNRLQRHDEFQAREKDQARRDEESRDFKREMAEMQANLAREIKAMGAAANEQTESIADPDNPGQSILVSRHDLFKGKVRKLANKPLGAGEAGIVNASYAVKDGVQSIESMLNPNTIQKFQQTKLADAEEPENLEDKLGFFKGRWNEWLANMGASGDEELITLARKLHALELSHAKIYGRSSYMMMEMLRKTFGTLGQTPEGVRAALRVMRDQADEFITARTPGRGKEGSEDNEEDIPEYETDKTGNLVRKK